jgi:hypothetical protein
MELNAKITKEMMEKARDEAVAMIRQDHLLNVDHEFQSELIKRLPDNTFNAIVMEEPAELIQAISKQIRADDDIYELQPYRIAAEIADVYIILEWLKIKYNIPQALVNNAIKDKNVKNKAKWFL